MWVEEKWMQLYLQHPVKSSNSRLSLLEKINDDAKKSVCWSTNPCTTSLRKCGIHIVYVSPVTPPIISLCFGEQKKLLFKGASRGGVGERCTPFVSEVKSFVLKSVCGKWLPQPFSKGIWILSYHCYKDCNFFFLFSNFFIIDHKHFFFLSWWIEKKNPNFTPKPLIGSGFIII